MSLSEFCFVQSPNILSDDDREFLSKKCKNWYSLIALGHILHKKNMEYNIKTYCISESNEKTWLIKIHTNKLDRFFEKKSFLIRDINEKSDIIIIENLANDILDHLSEIFKEHCIGITQETYLYCNYKVISPKVFNILFSEYFELFIKKWVCRVRSRSRSSPPGIGFTSLYKKEKERIRKNSIIGINRLDKKNE